MTNVHGTRKNEPVEGILCVLQNILQRGNPTQPSEYLLSKFGSVPEKPEALIAKEPARWNRIKGDNSTGYNPAKKFYHELLPKYLGEYGFIQQLMLPEARFIDVLDEPGDMRSEQMDFYLPQMKLTIEIDGSGHGEEVQQIKDRGRDDALQANGIKVLRIKTTNLAAENDVFRSQMEQLLEAVKKHANIRPYKAAVEREKDTKSMRLDAVMRMQVALINAFRYGKLDISADEIHIAIIHCDLQEPEKLLKIAYEDLGIWLDNIAHLAKVDVSLPELHIEKQSDDADIALDFNMRKRYMDIDEKDISDKTVYVRTAYLFDKSYYKVASSDKLFYSFPAASEEEDDKCLLHLMRNIFHHNEFRGGQLPIIKHALGCNDTIGILPTGTGKSLCYQMAALLQPGVTLVTVPIIALMQDQKDGMDRNGISQVAYISSEVVGAERAKVMDGFTRGKYQFMMMSPERTQNKEFIGCLTRIDQNLNFSYAVIDEVHCLSEWGHDFRVSYLRLIPTLREHCKKSKVCLLGLTATASQAVLNDLKAEFDIDGTGIKALSSMDRPELQFKRYVVSSYQERERLIGEIVGRDDVPYKDSKGVKKNGVGLIFCRTVRSHGDNPSCQRIREYLASEKKMPIGEKLLMYAGALDTSKKKEAQAKFMDKNFDGVMVCTKAFGMGIDKENIKYTIHTSLPESIESFYQEAGRAGRDEDKSGKSNCYILYYPEKHIPQEQLNKIFQNTTSVDERKSLSKPLNHDLDTIMFFWNKNRQTVDEEYADIRKMLDLLFQQHSSNIEFYGDDDLKAKQNSLYKLALVEIIKGWTVEYTRGISGGNIHVDYADKFDYKNIEKALIRYIHKHDAEFTLDGTVQRYDKYYKLFHQNEKKPVENALKVLIEWGNDNILYNRLQSTYNMMELCSPDVSDEDFRERINDYFKYTEDSVVFETIIQYPQAYEYWMQILFKGKDRTSDNLLSPEEGRAQLSSLLRYLESYGSNTGLNYLSGLLRLICSDFEGTEGEWRLRDSLTNMKESMDDFIVADVLDITMGIANSFDEHRKNQLASVMVECYPEKADEFYEVMQDYSSFAAMLNNRTKKISDILEDNLKWTI